jgi:plastocyanin
MRPSRRTVVAVVAGALLIGAGCSDDDDRRPGPRDLEGYDATPDAELRVDEDGFEPASLTIPAGGIVELTNAGDQPHALSGPRDIETGELQPGDTVAIVLDDPGRFEYHDALAPEHGGVIVIEPAP